MKNVTFSIKKSAIFHNTVKFKNIIKITFVFEFETDVKNNLI